MGTVVEQLGAANLAVCDFGVGFAVSLKRCASRRFQPQLSRRSSQFELLFGTESAEQVLFL